MDPTTVLAGTILILNRDPTPSESVLLNYFDRY